jgi:hypothetical protein
LSHSTSPMVDLCDDFSLDFCLTILGDKEVKPTFHPYFDTQLLTLPSTSFVHGIKDFSPLLNQIRPLKTWLR